MMSDNFSWAVAFGLLRGVAIMFVILAVRNFWHALAASGFWGQ